MKGPLFYSKILLFGEYGIIRDSKGLSIPYNFYNGALKREENPSAEAIHIEAKRIENIPGTHTVTYNSSVDSIEIKHTAHNREGFALGAVIAAEWIIGKKGIFSMKDVLSL